MSDQESVTVLAKNALDILGGHLPGCRYALIVTDEKTSATVFCHRGGDPAEVEVVVREIADSLRDGTFDRVMEESAHVTPV